MEHGWREDFPSVLLFSLGVFAQLNETAPQAQKKNPEFSPSNLAHFLLKKLSQIYHGTDQGTFPLLAPEASLRILKQLKFCLGSPGNRNFGHKFVWAGQILPWIAWISKISTQNRERRLIFALDRLEIVRKGQILTHMDWKSQILWLKIVWNGQGVVPVPLGSGKKKRNLSPCHFKIER